MVATRLEYLLMALRLALCLVLSVHSRAIFAKDGGSSSGSGYQAGAGVNVGYHPNVQTWVKGQKDQATYRFTGYSWLAYITNMIERKDNARSFIPPSLAVWGDVLTNAYHTEDPTGEKAEEVIKTQGIGLGIVSREKSYGINLAILMGLERAYLNQSGDTPRSQKYPYGASSRLGLGWSPILGDLALDIRIDWVFKYFPPTKSGDDSLKAMEQQSFLPMLGISYFK